MCNIGTCRGHRIASQRVNDLYCLTTYASVLVFLLLSTLLYTKASLLSSFFFEDDTEVLHHRGVKSSFEDNMWEMEIIHALLASKA
jgi:hypothetical protein